MKNSTWYRYHDVALAPHSYFEGLHTLGTLHDSDIDIV